MRDKVVSLAEAASLIPSACTLGLGGLMLRRHPMALICEIIRQGKRDLTLQTWVGGIDVDLLARLMQRFDEFAHGCAEFRVIFLNFAYVWPRLVGSSLEPESGG